MAKKQFEIPFILLSGGIGSGDGAVINDPSSGQGTPDHPYACEYETWQYKFGVNLVDPDGIDFDDYRQWWHNNNFSETDWDKVNPGISWTVGEPHP